MDLKPFAVVGIAFVLLVLVGSALLFIDAAKQGLSTSKIQPSPVPAQVIVQENAVQENQSEPVKLVNGDIGFVESDFPNFTLTASGRKTLANVPLESRQTMQELGFQHSFETWLQNTVLTGNETPSSDFRQIQSTVFIFSNNSNAGLFFNNLRTNVETGPDVVEIKDVEYGEAAFAYIEKYEREFPFEQHYVVFLERNAVAMASVTSLQSANMTADLAFQAAGNLESKIAGV